VVDVFVPACDAREPPMDSHELNDHAILSRRPSAHVFGRYYSMLLNNGRRRKMMMVMVVMITMITAVLWRLACRDYQGV
jgi:hypothetical protein